MPVELLEAVTTFDAVILAGGSFPTHRVPLAIAHRATYLCCCDKAGLLAVRHGLEPQAIVGDGDSLPPEWQARMKDRLHLVAEQEDNDLTKATRHVVARGARRIAYLGATGLREDHTLANIALMSRYRREMGVEPVLVTDYGWFRVAVGNQTFASFRGQQVSVFNVDCKHLEGRGFKWALRPFSEWWQGTLNEALAETVSIEADGTYMLYFTFNPKTV